MSERDFKSESEKERETKLKALMDYFKRIRSNNAHIIYTTQRTRKDK